MRTKKTPFAQLSKKKRRKMGMKLRQEILQNRELFGGRFTSHQYLIEPEDDLICNQWFDFIFPGRHVYEIWNATIVTARMTFWDKVWGLAFEKTYAMLSEDEREKEFEHESIPADIDANGKVLTWKWKEKEPIRYAQYDGHTFTEYHRKIEREIVSNEPPEIYECIETDFSFAGLGVDLQIVVDAEAITYPLVEETLDRFIALNYMSWRSESHIPRNKLPLESEADAVAKGLKVCQSMPIRGT